MSPKAPSDPSPSRQVRLLFLLILISLPILLIVLLETGLQLFDYGEDLSLFVPTPDENSPTLGVNLNIGRRYYYFSSDQFDPKPQKDLFLKQKPANGYRIFVLGASTAAGFPFGTNVSFSRFLHQRLVDVFTEHHVEVINTAITSINSYSLLDFVDEILEQQPDAILLYAGQNEYLGPFGPVAQVTLGRSPWMVRSILKLQRFKTFLLIRDLFSPLIKQMANNITPTSIQGSQGGVDSNFIANTKVPLDSELYKRGVTQFESNLRLIIQKVKKQDVDLVLSEIVSNLRDQPPFPTFESDSLDPARVKYSQARTLEAQGHYDGARLAYYQAKDLDPVRFRSPEAFNDILTKLSAEFNIPLVPMRSEFEDISPNGLIGNNIMLDHVHPTKEGYFLMANAFYRTMKQEKMIEANWPKISPVVVRSYLERWPFTALDSVYSHLVIENLISGWPFKVSNFSSIYANETVLDKFQLHDLVDSIGLKTYTIPGYSLQQGHLELAQHYESEGNIEAALAEYETLIASIPFIDNFYEDAVRILIKNKEFIRCRKLLINGLHYNPSAKIYKLLGQTELVMEMLALAIEHLQLSHQKRADDPQVIRNLIKAYAAVGEFNLAQNMLSYYESVSNDLPTVHSLGRAVSRSKELYLQALEKVQQAETLIKSNDFKSAIQLLQTSVKMKETHQASALMGKLLLNAGQADLALRYLERARNMSLNVDPSLLYFMSRTYAMQGQHLEANKLYLELKSKHPAVELLDRLESDLRKMGYVL